MPSLVEGDDRATVKKVVPKANNKIHAVGVARLYVAHPNPQQWTFTGLQGAAVLANDLVGNTFWIKLVDLSPANRGVIWDQEIYEGFSYNQDRIFFHTFELEDCLAGLSFADDKEAKKFKQKIDEREKNAHKNTRSKPFGSAAGAGDPGNTGKSHSRLGGLGSFLHRDKHSRESNGPPQSIIPKQDIPVSSKNDLEHIDPVLLQELMGMGMTEDTIAENADFIKMYVENDRKKKEQAKHSRAPPPPPPGQLSPDNTGSTGRGPPPAPPPARRGKAEPNRPASPTPAPSPPASTGPRTFRAPPPLADAGKFAESPNAPPPGLRGRNTSDHLAHPGPPPPPRPPKISMDEEEEDAPRFGVPPPFQTDRQVPPPPPARSSGPPPTPARGSVPPPPPARNVHAAPPPAVLAAPPPLPPKAASSGGPPPPPARDARAVPPPPSSPGISSFAPPPPPPPMPSSSGPPPPPPMPASAAAGPPPPPPLPSGGGPPPPPPPAMPAANSSAPPLPQATGGRDGLLADIRGGARLKKVSDSEKRDRSAAIVPGGAAAPAPVGAPAAPAGGEGGLAGALASALAARKSKVGQSDDEDDKDDW